MENKGIHLLSPLQIKEAAKTGVGREEAGEKLYTKKKIIKKKSVLLCGDARKTQTHCQIETKRRGRRTYERKTRDQTCKEGRKERRDTRGHQGRLTHRHTHRIHKGVGWSLQGGSAVSTTFSSAYSAQLQCPPLY